MEIKSMLPLLLTELEHSSCRSPGVPIMEYIIDGPGFGRSLVKFLYVTNTQIYRAQITSSSGLQQPKNDPIHCREPQHLGNPYAQRDPSSVNCFYVRLRPQPAEATRLSNSPIGQYAMM
jgi:hypothetical protein